MRMAGLKRTDCATVDYVVSLIRGNTKAIVRQMMIVSAYNGLVKRQKETTQLGKVTRHLLVFVRVISSGIATAT